MNDHSIVALWMAGFLLIVVSLLNVSSSDELLITLEQYQKVLEEGNIDSIRVIDDIPYIKLHEPEKFQVGNGFQEHDRVTVNIGSITPAMVTDWESRDIHLLFEEREQNWLSVMEDTVPWLLIPGLVCLGVGYIVHEARKSKAGIKTPRERLKELDDQFKAGGVSAEDYMQQKTDILSEM